MIMWTLLSEKYRRSTKSNYVMLRAWKDKELVKLDIQFNRKRRWRLAKTRMSSSSSEKGYVSSLKYLKDPYSS